MRRINFGASILGLVASAILVTASGDARSDVQPYQGIPADQREVVSSGQAIINMAGSGAPTAIWSTLDHGQMAECLDCISWVAPLLFDDNAKTREISAWWLRQRLFGVFGPGEVYQQTLNTLASDANPTRRAYAASAIGEFLEGAGIQPLATALATDADAGVRASAASALGRINSDGAGALSKAFSDTDPNVRYAALAAAGHVTAFTDSASTAAVLGDSNALVRRAAVLLLDQMRAKDTVAAVLSLAQNDADVQVRLGACHALGNFGDPSVAGAVQAISQNDASSLVRDIASMALRNL